MSFFRFSASESQKAHATDADAETTKSFDATTFQQLNIQVEAGAKGQSVCLRQLANTTLENEASKMKHQKMKARKCCRKVDDSVRLQHFGASSKLIGRKIFVSLRIPLKN
jgi:hypothetical protein